MSDDEFFNSPGQREKSTDIKTEDKQRSIFNDTAQNIEIKEKDKQKTIKIIEAKIPSVTDVMDSIIFDQTNECDNDSDREKYTPNLNASQNIELENSNLPNKMLNLKNKNISESECSDVDVSPILTAKDVKNIKILKNDSVKKSSSSSSIQNKSVHNKEQALELKQFLGSIIDRNSRDEVSSNSNTIKNYSFSNDKLKAIDKENLRLLEKITLYASESKKSRQSLNQNSKIAMRPASSSHSRTSSAAVNRRMQQRKIEEENMAMLRRLQQVRPSKELQAVNANRPSSSLSTRSTSMTSLRSGSAKRRTSAQNLEGEFTFRSNHLEPSTALQFS